MQTKVKENIYSILRFLPYYLLLFLAKYFWHSLTYIYLTKTIKKTLTQVVYMCVCMYTQIQRDNKCLL